MKNKFWPWTKKLCPGHTTDCSLATQTMGLTSALCREPMEKRGENGPKKIICDLLKSLRSWHWRGWAGHSQGVWFHSKCSTQGLCWARDSYFYFLKPAFVFTFPDPRQPTFLQEFLPSHHARSDANSNKVLMIESKSELILESPIMRLVNFHIWSRPVYRKTIEWSWAKPFSIIHNHP